MKKILFLMAFLLAGSMGQAQNLKFGIKLGAGSSMTTLKNSLVINDGTPSGLVFEEGNMDMSFHFGFTSRVGIASFYVMPELYFSSVSNEIKFTDSGSTTPSVLAQSMTRMDIPVLFGKKFADVFRVNAGPVASLVLNRKSGVTNQLASLLGADVVSEDPNSFTFGLQAGIGVDISRLTFDLRYETNLSWLGSNLTVQGNNYDFDLRAQQVLLSLGILF